MNLKFQKYLNKEYNFEKTYKTPNRKIYGLNSTTTLLL